MADVSDSRWFAGTTEYRDFTAQRDDRSAQGTSSLTGVCVESLVAVTPACAYSAEALEQTHISPMNDAVAIVVETNPFTFRDNGVPIDLVRRIVVVEKRRILLNMRVDMSAPSVLSTPIHDRSTRGDIDRPLQTYAIIVAILSERLKTRFCVFYDREYTLDALRFALPRERTVDLGQYVLLRNDALRKGGTVWSRSRAYTAFLEDLWRLILKRVVPSDPVENARGLLDLFDGVVKSFHPQPMTHSSTGLLQATGIHVSVALMNFRSRCISNCSLAKSSREGNDPVLDDCRD